MLGLKLNYVSKKGYSWLDGLFVKMADDILLYITSRPMLKVREAELNMKPEFQRRSQPMNL